MDTLKKELIEAARAYYHGESEVMTDVEYDSKLEILRNLVSEEDLANDKELRDLLEDSPSAGTLPDNAAITHNTPMLSLAKAKTEDELLKYYSKLIKGGATGFTLQAKLDGLAMSAHYDDGKLSLIATRGDGIVGEDLTYLAYCKDVEVVGLPKTINSKSHIELRGEIFIRDSQFTEINKNRLNAIGEEFSNSRNAVSGIVKKAESGLGYHAQLTFVVYSAFEQGNPVHPEIVLKLNESLLNSLELTRQEVGEFNSICTTGADYDELHKAVVKFGELRASFDVPTDGVVIKPINEIEMLVSMGSTSHHPNAYIAYKYPSTLAIAQVEEIIVSVGKTGRLTPQARITPANIDGVIVTRVSLHNFNWLYEMGIKVGSIVHVTRANDVIPAIVEVVVPGNGDIMEVPNVCPECNSALYSDDVKWPPKTLSCNNEECSSRLYFYMRSLVSRQYLDIDGLSLVGLEFLCDNHIIKNIVDLLNLDVETLSNVGMGRVNKAGNEILMGETRAKKIYDSIQNAKQNTPSFRLLASLGIKNLGPESAKKLINHFKGLENVFVATREQVQAVEGFGEINVDSFFARRETALSMLTQLKENGVNINDPEFNREIAGTFSISGSVEGFANREAVVEYMESLGWVYHKSPTASTDVLFADPEGTSSKIQKAKKNGTKIVKSIQDI